MSYMLVILTRNKQKEICSWIDFVQHVCAIKDKDRMQTQKHSIV